MLDSLRAKLLQETQFRVVHLLEKTMRTTLFLKWMISRECFLEVMDIMKSYARHHWLRLVTQLVVMITNTNVSQYCSGEAVLSLLVSCSYLR